MADQRVYRISTHSKFWRNGDAYMSRTWAQGMDGLLREIQHVQEIHDFDQGMCDGIEVRVHRVDPDIEFEELCK